MSSTKPHPFLKFMFLFNFLLPGNYVQELCSGEVATFHELTPEGFPAQLDFPSPLSHETQELQGPAGSHVPSLSFTLRLLFSQGRQSLGL